MSVLLYSGETWAIVKQNISPLAVFQNCLQRICCIFLVDYVPDLDVLNRCNTFSVEPQLQSKRFRWLSHIIKMPNDRLPKMLLFGEFKGLHQPGRLRSTFADVVLRLCHSCHINRGYRDAQNRYKTCHART